MGPIHILLLSPKIMQNLVPDDVTCFQHQFELDFELSFEFEFVGQEIPWTEKFEISPDYQARGDGGFVVLGEESRTGIHGHR
jgi:hypothetical protein